MNRALLPLAMLLATSVSAHDVRVVSPPGGDPGNPLSTPWAVAADGCGGVYVTGINSDVVIYRDNLGETSVVIDADGDGETAMRTPESAETDADCNVIAGARGSNAVFRVSPLGEIEKLIDGAGDGVNPLTVIGGVATAADGSVYASGLASNNVFRIATDGTITQIIDASGDGSNALLGATAVEADDAGNVYVTGADSNNVFRIAPDATISQILDAAGDGVSGMDNPTDVAADELGNVYVAARNSDNVFRIAPGGTASLVMDSSGDGNNPLQRPTVAKYEDGYLYVAGHGSNNLFRIDTGTLEAVQLLGPDGDGLEDYKGPIGVSVTPGGGAVYAAGSNSNNVFEIDSGGSAGMILAGSQLHDPGALDVDIFGNVSAASFFGNAVVRIAPDGTETTVIGADGDGSHPLTMPSALDSDSQGNLFVAGQFSENVFRVHPNGVIHQIADASGDGVHDLVLPSDLATDGSGNVVVLDESKVFRIRPSGHIAMIFDGSEAGDPPFSEPAAIAVDHRANVYVAAQGSNNVLRIRPDGVVEEALTAVGNGVAPLNGPAALAVGPDDSVYVAGKNSNNVFRIPVAGAPQLLLDAVGDGVNPLLRPIALTTDERGDVFVVSAADGSVFRIAQNGVVTRVADNSGDGVHPLTTPGGLAAAGGRVVVSDQVGNNVFAAEPEIGVSVEASQTWFVASPPPTFALGMHNPTTSAQSASLDLVLRSGDGTLIPLVADVPISLPPGADFLFPLALPFGGLLPPGDYSLIAATHVDDAALDTDSYDFEFVTAATRGPVFTEVAALAGLDFAQAPPNETPNCLQPLDPQMPGPGFDCMQESMAGAAAAGDYDNDGFADLYVTRIYESDFLFRNRGDGTFEDVTAAAGLGGVRQTNGAAWVDIDNDGDRDLYVNTQDELRNYLFVNQGDGTFVEEAYARNAAIDTGEPHWSMSIAVGDMDNDGWADIYTTDWVASFMIPEGGQSHARLLRNDGTGQFVDATNASGVAIDGWPAMPWYMQLNGALAFAASLTDLDGDGFQDLAITGEMGSSRLFWNNGDGTFLEGTDAAGLATSASEMGSTFGDLDGDGDFEWLVTAISCEPPYTRENLDCSGNRVYYYEGDRQFADKTDAAGLRIGHWGWGAALFDYDNDGDLDAVHTNGQEVRGPSTAEDNYNYDPMRFFRNDDGVFVERENLVQLSDREDGHGLLTLDYDRDGDLDIFLVNTGGPVRLYRNDGGNARDHLRVTVEGTLSNRDGLGARVTVQSTPGGPLQVREVGTRTHYQGQSELAEHFGLGDGGAPVHRVAVYWPASGIEQIFDNVPRNASLHVIETAGAATLAAGSGKVRRIPAR